MDDGQAAEENIESLLEAYALGILEPDEMTAMEAHLATCPRCPGELAALRRTVAAFALLTDTDDVPVPKDHAVRFAQKLAATPPQRATAIVPVPVVAPAPRPQPRPLVAAEPVGPLAALRAWLGGGFLRSGWAAAGIMAVLLLATGFWGISLQNQVQAVQAEQARLQLELTQARSDQANLQLQVTTLRTASDALQKERAQALAVLGASQVVAHPLAGTEALPGASGTMWVDPATNRAVLITRNLPALPTDRTYEFWLIADTAHPAGTFQTTPDGYGLLIIDPQQPLGAFQQAGITTEKAGGSETPTAPILLQGSL
jgi:anti-sigma-K factor RskA